MKRLLRSGIGAICAVAMAATGLGAVAQSAYAYLYTGDSGTSGSETEEPTNLDTDTTATPTGSIIVKNVNADDAFVGYQLLELNTEGSRTNNEGYQYVENPKYIGYLLWAIPNEDGTAKTPNDIWTSCTANSIDTSTCTDLTAFKITNAADRLKAVYDYIQSLDTSTTNSDASTWDYMTDPSSQTHSYFSTVFAKIQAAQLEPDIYDTNDSGEKVGIAATTTDDTNYTVTLTGESGYYLVHQTAGAETYELILADTTSSDEDHKAEVEPKKASLIFTKKVKDYDTSAINGYNTVTTEGGETITSLLTDWQDSADTLANAYATTWNASGYMHANAILFRLQATLPSDVASYANGYKLVFHDQPSLGMYNGNMQVAIRNIRVYVGEVTTERDAPALGQTAGSYFEDPNLVTGWDLQCASTCATTMVDGPTTSSPDKEYAYNASISAVTRPVTEPTSETMVSAGDGFAIGFDDLTQATYVNQTNEDGSAKKVVLTPGATVTVIYESTVERSNGIGVDATTRGGLIGSYGNTNTAYAEYSVDPSALTASGDTNSIVSTNTTVTGLSVPDSVVIYKYGLDVSKVDKSGTPLANAKFSLYEFVAEDSYRVGTVWSTETLWSTATPTGYLTKGQQIVMYDDGSQTVIDADTDVPDNGTVVFIAPQNGWFVVANNNIAADAVLDENGKVIAYTANFRNLGDGLYRLVESQEPAGYTPANDTYFELVATHSSDTDTYSLTYMGVNSSSNYAKSDVSGFTTNSVAVKIGTTGEGDEEEDVTVESTNALLTVAIQNSGGYRLPSTGGLGTFMLYTIGGLMILITIMGLAYSLRKQQQEV